MARKQSAGLLMYRRRSGALEVLLVHPGGPLWAGKDVGAWTIPKGEIAEGEAPFVAACREFGEETGLTPQGPFVELTPIRQRGGKLVHAWAFAGDCDVGAVRSNTFVMQWPPRSGKMAEFPEVDRAELFAVGAAVGKINAGQVALIEELVRVVG